MTADTSQRTGRPVVRLAGITGEPLAVDTCLDAVRDPGAGGTAVFLGTVRDDDGGRTVVELEYEAHPRAAAELARVAERVADGSGVTAVAVQHRTGLLAVGDVAVVVAAAAAHRGEAFDACRRLIDELKHEVPIWKRQVFADGTEEWVHCGC